MGSELMKRVERIAHERGIGEVHLDTAVRKTDLVAFYTKRGYVAFDEVFAWPGTNYDSQKLPEDAEARPVALGQRL